MSVFTKLLLENSCDRKFYSLNLNYPGLGYCIITYTKDSNPLLSFSGDPYLLSVLDNIESVTSSIWDNLNQNTRVSFFGNPTL